MAEEIRVLRCLWCRVDVIVSAYQYETIVCFCGSVMQVVDATVPLWVVLHDG